MDIREKVEAFLAANGENPHQPMTPLEFQRLHGVKRQTIEQILAGKITQPRVGA